MNNTAKYLVVFSDRDKVTGQNFGIHHSHYDWPKDISVDQMQEMAQHEADEYVWVIDDIYRMEPVFSKSRRTP